MEQNAKKKWRSRCNFCDVSRWDIGPFAIFEHFGFDMGRTREKKFNSCKVLRRGVEKYAEQYAKLEALHKHAMEQKKARRDADQQHDRLVLFEEDAEFAKDGVNAVQARNLGKIEAPKGPIAESFAKSPPPSRPQITHAPRAISGLVTPTQQNILHAVRVDAPSESIQAASVCGDAEYSSKTGFSARRQLDEIWSEAFYECSLPFSLANNPKFKEAINKTARLVRPLSIALHFLA